MDSGGKRRTIRIGVWVTILGLLLGVLSSIIMATEADAHTALRSISPQDGSSLATAPTQVVLTFDEAVSTSFATVTVTGAQGVVSAGKAVVAGATVTQALLPNLPNGRYAVAYRVVSDDGHPVSDKSTFTIAVATSPSQTAGPSATPLPATPGSAASTAPTLASGSDGTNGGLGLRVGLAVGVAALALVGGTALVASSRRRSGE
ncbi:copper resistance CopC family protein [Pedococcus badiiscoriae]|nr:copper resistance CopC family protein [Pedococcus badiiscoriae]